MKNRHLDKALNARQESSLIENLRVSYFKASHIGKEDLI